MTSQVTLSSWAIILTRKSWVYGSWVIWVMIHSFKTLVTHPLPTIIYFPLHVIHQSCLGSEQPHGLHVLFHAPKNIAPLLVTPYIITRYHPVTTSRLNPSLCTVGLLCVCVCVVYLFFKNFFSFYQSIRLLSRKTVNIYLYLASLFPISIAVVPLYSTYLCVSVCVCVCVCFSLCVVIYGRPM